MTARSEGPGDDEVQFLFVKGADPIICQYCQADITSQTFHQRNAHYNAHISSDESITAIGTLLVEQVHCKSGSSDPWLRQTLSDATTSNPQSVQYSNKFQSLRNLIPGNTRRSGKEREFPEEQNIFWYPRLLSAPPLNFSPGLIHLVRKALLKSHEKDKTERAWLCDPLAVHIESEIWDKGWGCGYRNFLMVCAALMSQTRQPQYRVLLDSPPRPGVRNLQVIVEDAWANGFDDEGARELKRHLVGTKTWIGTAELFTAMSFRGIPSTLVDFELPSISYARADVRKLQEWIMHYFSAGENPSTIDEALRSGSVVGTNKMPLVLQHKGHSRTIVGIERVKNNVINLLEFDPSRRIPRAVRNAGLAIHSPENASETSKRASTSNVMHQVLHPVETIRSHKRRASDVSKNDTNKVLKKMRAGQGADHAIVINDDDDDVTEGDTEGPVAHNVSKTNEYSGSIGENLVDQTLKLIRLTTVKLEKHHKYQILYFPLDDPLSEEERAARRVVTSTKIT